MFTFNNKISQIIISGDKNNLGIVLSINKRFYKEFGYKK